MARTADLHIRIDPETKTGAEELFAMFGITVTDAVMMFLRQSLLVGGLPFELRRPRYNAETEAAIREANDIMAGKIQTKSYSSLEEFYADLENEDDDSEKL
ncbi:MAG: type II toxin-antitoxin system RelB/DinJ family antitoxin [Oscillospiraceae bacterium]|nr:type II toxin-antitoxin system RelB/DinJ family antitoxin [Oscillospiraceae bacterium]